jgi:hypothetical protein
MVIGMISKIASQKIQRWFRRGWGGSEADGRSDSGRPWKEIGEGGTISHHMQGP